MEEKETTTAKALAERAKRDLWAKVCSEAVNRGCVLWRDESDEPGNHYIIRPDGMTFFAYAGHGVNFASHKPMAWTYIYPYIDIDLIHRAGVPQHLCGDAWSGLNPFLRGLDAKGARGTEPRDTRRDADPRNYANRLRRTQRRRLDTDPRRQILHNTPTPNSKLITE